jgi:hypothetical protein
MSQESDESRGPETEGSQASGSQIEDFNDIDKFNNSGNFKKLIIYSGQMNNQTYQPSRTEQVLEQEESSSVLPQHISSWKS